MSYEFLLLAPEPLEGASVAVGGSSSSAAAGMPWSNLLTPYSFEKARTSSLTGMTLELDLGAASEIDTVLMLYSNARSDTDWRIRLADTQPDLTSATGDDDSGTIDFLPASTPSTVADDWPKGTLGFWQAASTRTRRWIKIDFTDATHPDGYLQFGALLLGKAWQPSRTPTWGGRPASEQEQPNRSRSVAGDLFVVPAPRPTGAIYRLNNLTEAEYDALRRIYRLRGTSKQVATIFDPTNTAYLHGNIVHGYLADNSPIARPRYVAGGAEWSAEVSIESATG